MGVERETVRESDRDRERIPSRPRATSAEPSVGLDPMNHDIVT